MGVEFKETPGQGDPLQPIAPTSPLAGSQSVPEEIDGMTDEEIERAYTDHGKAVRAARMAAEPLPELKPEDIPEELDDVLSPSPAKIEEPSPAVPENGGGTVVVEKVPTEEETAAKARADADEETRKARERLQQAHAARIAGEVGFLREQLAKAKQTEFGGDAGTETADLSALQERLDGLVKSLETDGIAQVVNAAMQPAFASPELRGLTQEEIQRISQPYERYWQEATTASSADTAKLLSEAVAQNIIADAKNLVRAKAEAAAVQARASLKPVTEAAKRTAAVETSSGVARSRPRTVEELSPEQQERLLDRMLRQGLVR